MKVPPTEEPHEGRCGALNRRGERCRNIAGYKTDHVGQGRCRWHGGATPIRHGRYSNVERPDLIELIARHEADPDPHNLEPIIARAKGYLDSFQHRFAHMLEPGDEVDLARDSAAYRTAADLLESVTRTIERAERIQVLGGISIQELRRLMLEFARVVETYVHDPKTLEQIRVGWLACKPMLPKAE